MKITPAAGSNALVFVLIAMLTIFLQITVILGTTTFSRRISGHYIRYTSLYDLALAGSESALFLLYRETDKDIIAGRALMRLYNEENEEIDRHLSFKDGEFRIDTFFTALFREEKSYMINEFLTGTFNPDSSGRRYFSYSLGVSTGTYHVHISLCENNINAVAYKSADSRNGNPLRTFSSVMWPNFIHQAAVQPLSYTWRGNPPSHFSTGAHPNADFLDTPFPSNFNYSAFYTYAFHEQPTLIIYNGNLEIFGTLPFKGIIAAAGDVSINAPVTGSVIAAGAIYGLEWIEHCENMLFSIPMEEGFRRKIFDFFGLTDFEQEEDVLKHVKIDDFSLQLLQIYDIKPRMAGFQQQAN